MQKIGCSKLQLKNKQMVERLRRLNMLADIVCARYFSMMSRGRKEWKVWKSLLKKCHFSLFSLSNLMGTKQWVNWKHYKPRKHLNIAVSIKAIFIPKINQSLGSIKLELHCRWIGFETLYWRHQTESKWSNMLWTLQTSINKQRIRN